MLIGKTPVFEFKREIAGGSLNVAKAYSLPRLIQSADCHINAIPVNFGRELQMIRITLDFQKMSVVSLSEFPS